MAQNSNERINRLEERISELEDKLFAFMRKYEIERRKNRKLQRYAQSSMIFVK